MTFTEYFGLIVLGWSLSALIDWLRSRRATPPNQRKKLADFRMSLSWFALFAVYFALSFIFHTSARPASWEVIGVTVAFLGLLGIAMNEIRIAFRARNANVQRSPVDSGT
jgi:hypothetical protein